MFTVCTLVRVFWLRHVFIYMCIFFSFQLSEDEGFITTEASSSAASPVDGWIEEDIWEEALHTVPNQHYVWERIGW